MSEDPRTTQTKQRLRDATLVTIREQGIAHVSARSIAKTGGVNQALVFYHFGSVAGLVAQACEQATADRVALLAPQLEGVSTFEGLIVAAGQIQASERAAGNVTVLAQVLAGAQADPTYAEAAHRGLEQWRERIEPAVARVIDSSPFGGVIDAASLTQLLTATFIGLELTEPTRSEADRRLGDVLAGLAPVARALDGLGPVARRAVARFLAQRRA